MQQRQNVFKISTFHTHLPSELTGTASTFTTAHLFYPPNLMTPQTQEQCKNAFGKYMLMKGKMGNYKLQEIKLQPVSKWISSGYLLHFTALQPGLALWLSHLQS